MKGYKLNYKWFIDVHEKQHIVHQNLVREVGHLLFCVFDLL